MMRRSGWCLILPVVLLWIAAVMLPAGRGISILLTSTQAEPQSLAGTHAFSELVVTTVLWSLGIAVGALCIGWLPGRWLGHQFRVSRRRGIAAGVILLAPILLPAYVVFWCWWQAWPPGSAAFDFIVRHDLVARIRTFTLGLGLLCWSWPVVTWFVAASVANHDQTLPDLQRMDNARWHHRWRDAWFSDRRALLAGGLVVAILTAGNTVCFDLAEVFTVGNELRAREAMGASHRALLQLGIVPAVIQCGAVVAVWWLLHGGRATGRTVSRPRPQRSVMVTTLALVVLSIIVPVSLVGRSLIELIASERGSETIQQYFTFHSTSLQNSALLGVMVALALAVCAGGLAIMWMDDRRWVRILAHLMALTWLVASAIPGTLVAVACEAMWNESGWRQAIYRSPAVLVLGDVARFGWLIVLPARWMAMQEPRAHRDLRRLDGVGSAGAILRATRPMLTAVMGIAAAGGGVAAMGEITNAALLRPVDFGVISSSILNAMHYQQPELVMLTLAVFGAAALVVAAFALGILARSSRQWSLVGAVVISAFVATTQFGCDRPVDAANIEPLDVEFIFGGPGRSPGQFVYPRAIAVDEERGRVFIVDKSARIQRFNLDGEHQLDWQMPEYENGKPTGLSVAPDGTVWVADTHYYRIMVYSPQGEELRRFGSYGFGDGQFIYPTDVAFHPSGDVYVAEYGGNDRIQVFAPDGTFKFAFGSPGTELGMLNRPQSLQFNDDGSELFVADACNHRIHVFSADGMPIRTIAGPGIGTGELSYPYDVKLLEDGTLMIAEFGNNRIQHLDSDGRCLDIRGSNGFDEGLLQYPWGVDGTSDRLFVLDSGNRRVQVIETP